MEFASLLKSLIAHLIVSSVLSLPPVPPHHTRQAVEEPTIGSELIRTSVIVDVPISFLWEFLGDNSNAQDWSCVFASIFDIEASSSEDMPLDGTGARRRCQRNQQPVGMYWDEQNALVGRDSTDGSRFKRIFTFDWKNQDAPNQWMTDIFHADAYTDNLYESLSPNSTKFTFSSTILGKTSWWWRNLFWLKGDRDYLQESFMVNQDNIKAMAEARYTDTEYLRPYPYWETGKLGDLATAVPNASVPATPPLEYSDHLQLLEKYPVLFDTVGTVVSCKAGHTCDVVH